MKHWYILVAVLLGVCTGCGAMEDFVLGPDPYLAEQVATAPAPTSCSAPPPAIVQTSEPPLFR